MSNENILLEMCCGMRNYITKLELNGLFLYFGTSLMAFENYVFLQEICHRALVAVGCSMAVAAAVPTAKKLTSQQG